MGPMLIWWGDEITAGQTIEDVAKITADHHGVAKNVKLNDIEDVKVAGLPAKRVQITFDRGIAFAPAGKGHGSMQAVLFLVRQNGQENGIWFEAPDADFDRYERDVASIAQDAVVTPRKPHKD